MFSTAAWTIGPEPAYAQNNGQARYVQSREPQNFFEALFPRLIEERIQRQSVTVEPVEVEKVSSPSYYNYTPDALTRVDLSSVSGSTAAEPKKQTARADIVRNPHVDAVDMGTTASAKPSVFDRISPNLGELNVAAEAEVAKALREHYESSPESLWLDDDLQANAHALSVLELFESAEKYGLDPADYIVRLPDEGAPVDAARFEVAMTARAVRYGVDASHGRVNPNGLSGYHDFKRDKNMASKVMAELGNSAAPASALEAMHPDNFPFRALMAELEEIDHGDDNLIVIPSDILIRPGETHEQVPNILAAIAKHGSPELKSRARELQLARSRPAKAEPASAPDLDEEEESASSTNEDLTDQIEQALEPGVEPTLYSSEVSDLVKAFQEENSLAADGIVGPNTVSKLTDVDPETKRQRVILAMERLRWHPHELGSTHVLINQPEFRARYVVDDRPQLDMRVVVGTRANQTSFFHDVIETVEYNPYWGIPRSILVNEYLSKLRANPAYLDERDYIVTDRQGRQIPSAAINWNAVGSKPPFDVRQKPGPRNALGQLKILFPNKHAIYMHDTPQRHLFERAHRAYSHGCVRLHKPREMAAAVLGTTVDHIDRQIAGGQHSSESVDRKIPVYVAYFTAWPDYEGGVNYFADTYGRDAKLTEALEATTQTREKTS